MIDDEDFVDLINEALIKRGNFRLGVDHFQKWNDTEFKRFRLSKPATQYLINKIKDEIVPSTRRNYALSSEQMILATMRFLATGSMLYVIGDLDGIDKATPSWY